MNLGMPVIVAIAAIGAVVPVGLATAAAAAAPEGLSAVQSRRLDEVYLRPDAQFAGYSKVVIDPVTVALKPNWLRDFNATRDVTRWLVPEDAQRIVANATSSMNKAVAKVFTARGFEIATEAGPGVLRVTPSVTDLDLYAPDVPFPGRQTYFTQDAVGEATLRLDVRDSATGTLLAQMVDRSTAHEVGRINRTDGASNRFWFDAMFTRWTDYCVAALGRSPPAP
jgi:hypothetical protein